MSGEPGPDQASYAATYAAVLEANIAVHSHMAADYKAHEPHYRPESIARVRKVLTALVEEVHGVDITQKMLDQVERGGPGARVTLTNGDTATFDPGEGAIDLVTSYSFLHHLFDVEPTFRTAARALRPGGQYYADLEPNHAFWAMLGEVDPDDSLDPLLRTEVEKVRFKDHEVASRLGVSKEVLDKAEYGKSITGGFAHDRLVATLKRAGFSKVEVSYHWFLGQAQIINEPGTDREAQVAKAARIDEVLQRALPLSRSLYKYLGFIATR